MHNNTFTVLYLYTQLLNQFNYHRLVKTKQIKLNCKKIKFVHEVIRLQVHNFLMAVSF